eukprot:764987-Hanusia_phi.AAC.6
MTAREVARKWSPTGLELIYNEKYSEKISEVSEREYDLDSEGTSDDDEDTSSLEDSDFDSILEANFSLPALVP